MQRGRPGRNGRVKAGWYEAPDRILAPIPQGLLDETYTDETGHVLPIPDSHAKWLAFHGVEPLTARERERRMRMSPEQRRRTAKERGEDVESLIAARQRNEGGP